ncbi:hypothetical protein AQUCO_00400242v1 [Aquilegia coerulea]|uniref:F-box associated beta-propeller type 3 domain-containing protein n=1 Tax=Aquilegia coerulea TaxID=218851 RepID=A0A2G5ETY6_AQUCA|nr:hypothetical protein AQUCO_00400242v1 [Aquilegia coerulea]
MVLCNPATKEYIEVPMNIQQVHANYTRYFDLNFIYDPVTDTYKAVRLDIYSSTTDLGYCEAYVYTLGTKVWRKIPTVFCLCNSYYASYIHGAFHWFKLFDKCTWTDRPRIVDTSSIISFDVGSEEFRIVAFIHSLVHLNKSDTTKKIVFGSVTRMSFYIT